MVAVAVVMTGVATVIINSPTVYLLYTASHHGGNRRVWPTTTEVKTHIHTHTLHHK